MVVGGCAQNGEVGQHSPNPQQGSVVSRSARALRFILAENLSKIINQRIWPSLKTPCPNVELSLYIHTGIPSFSQG